jgi:ankyrin repeat protein
MIQLLICMLMIFLYYFLTDADVHTKNKRLSTALHLSIMNNMFDVSVKLIEYGSDIDAKEWRNLKPFDLFSSKEMKNKFFLFSNFTFQSLVCNNYSLWFYIIQINDVKGIGKRVQFYAQNNPDLSR